MPPSTMTSTEGTGESSSNYRPLNNELNEDEVSYSGVETTRSAATDTEDPENQGAGDCSDEKPPSSQTPAAASDWFVWEFACVIFSAGILAAMIALLAVYDQRPQPDWQHVSLNSVISWLSTFSKASLLFAVGELLGQLKWVWFAQQERPLTDLRSFDWASRGAWGSLRLCWALRARHFATLGAFAMVLSLGFDPFSQNLIHTFVKPVGHSSETALLANVSTYETTGPEMFSAGKHLPSYYAISCK